MIKGNWNCLMRNVLQVLIPAGVPQILTIEELRAVAGLAPGDESKDMLLNGLGDAINARIPSICNIPGDGVNPPTFMTETLQETFWTDRLRRRHRRYDGNIYLSEVDQINDEYLFLSRIPVQTLLSVVADQNTLDLDSNSDIIIESDKGLLSREFGGWWGRKITVQYVAGNDTVPVQIKHAAFILARKYYNDVTREYALKRITVPDVVSKEYWLGGLSDPDIPSSVIDALQDYRRIMVIA
jgi:hypothetical protein